MLNKLGKFGILAVVLVALLICLRLLIFPPTICGLQN